jgi:FkbH-like protein
MFEFHQYDSQLHTQLDAKPERPYQPVTDIAGMALLFWDEHCVECAAPACYSTCDLYQARTDLRCRRFAFGAYKNYAFPSLRGYGVEISFKRWAKLEVLANTAIYPVPWVHFWERLLEYSAPVTDIAGRLLNRWTGNIKWAGLTYIARKKLTHALRRRAANREQAQAFLLEVYNPMPETVRLQIIFAVAQDDVPHNGERLSLPAPNLRTVSLPPGYSRHEVDARAFEPIVSRGLPLTITMIPEADNNARLVFLLADLVRFKPQDGAGAAAKKIKCVIWDLDNTLWDGILVEGDDVAVRPQVRELLEFWDERGVLQTVASKNDFEPAWEKLKELGVADYFVYPQLDWLPKSQKIKTIARKLNLGLDSFALIDDNPFELDEVSHALPQVTCIDVQDLESLRHDPRFEGSATEEARQRRRYYQEQIAREKDQEQFGEDYLGFLKSCATSLEIVPYSDEHRERIEELVQRTNQLNFSGRKYSRDELGKVVSDPELEKLVLRCADKYGSYGTVGFGLVRYSKDALQILDLMLSCRIQGKFIEQALFSHLFAHHNHHAASALWINFRRTERNTPAQNVLEAMGFRPCNEETDNTSAGLILRPQQSFNFDLINVHCLLCSTAKAVIGPTSG